MTWRAALCPLAPLRCGAGGLCLAPAPVPGRRVAAAQGMSKLARMGIAEQVRSLLLAGHVVHLAGLKGSCWQPCPAHG